MCADIAILSGNKRGERERNQLTLLSVTTRIGDTAPPKTNDKVRKLVPQKVPYEHELSELHFDLLLWNWNCISVDVLPRRERPERQLAKRRKVVTYDEEDLMLESRRAETELVGVWQSRTRARPKKKASRGLVVTEASDSSVEKTFVPTNVSAELATNEPTQPVVSGHSQSAAMS
ncbi:hypothetical protein AXG93_3671s1120 [Marchantia polymorpha subsp. ruderalis]|uniref:Uncharacterized protein n=1 Tax=Marchantia polymorpha subsp. ruderalis TaxID=1480154 RepID=A0A176WIC8_MARPO|nr:hypothetical protein AXG93_3671s1120 [Marchantia polymorpha subsp. ruderalis]